MEPPTTTDWSAVSIVVLGITVFATAQGLTYPLISFLLAERGASDLVVGLNAAFFMLGLGTSVLVLPFLSTCLRAGQVIIAGLIGSAIVLLTFALVDSLAAWFALRFALGVCVNAIYVFGEAWLNAATVDRMRGRVAGLYTTGMSAGFVIGPMLIPLLGSENGLAFAACAVVISVVAFAIRVLAQRARAEPEGVSLESIPRFVRAAPLLLSLVVVAGFTDAVVLALAPLHMMAGGASVAGASTFVAVMHAGMIVSQPLLGVLLDRLNRWAIACACLVVTAVSFAALALIPTTTFAVWFVGAVAGAALSGIYTSALSILGRYNRDGTLVAGASAFSLAYSIGGTIGPAVSGTSSTFFPGGAFLPVVVVCVATAILIGRVKSNCLGPASANR